MNNEEYLETLPSNSIDLIVTSPPYDEIRKYSGYDFNLDNLAMHLCRVIKPGRCIVWVIGDQTVNGCETLTSFQYALLFKQLGMNVETMIYEKASYLPINVKRYDHVFEYMFVFSKGKIEVFNPLKKDRKFFDSRVTKKMHRSKEGEFDRIGKLSQSPQVKLTNVWKINCAGGQATTDKEAYKHPAIMPEELARMHILSWSNPGETVLDPFAGSGTTLKMALLTGRKYIGVEVSQEYCEIARARLAKYTGVVVK